MSRGYQGLRILRIRRETDRVTHFVSDLDRRAFSRSGDQAGGRQHVGVLHRANLGEEAVKFGSVQKVAVQLSRITGRVVHPERFEVALRDLEKPSVDGDLIGGWRGQA